MGHPQAKAEAMVRADPQWSPHAFGVADKARQIWMKFGHLYRKDPMGLLGVIYSGALTHDIGKLEQPDLFSTDGQFTEEQLARVREHVKDGVRLLERLGYGSGQRIQKSMAGSHHFPFYQYGELPEEAWVPVLVARASDTAQAIQEELAGGRPWFAGPIQDYFNQARRPATLGVLMQRIFDEPQIQLYVRDRIEHVCADPLTEPWAPLLYDEVMRRGHAVEERRSWRTHYPADDVGVTIPTTVLPQAAQGTQLVH